MASVNIERLRRVRVLRQRVQNVQCCAILREYTRTDDATLSTLLHCQSFDSSGGGWDEMATFVHDGFSRQGSCLQRVEAADIRKMCAHI
jgi:hypothetical protein